MKKADMRKRMRQILAVPQFEDEEKTRAAGLLYHILMVFAVVIIGIAIGEQVTVGIPTDFADWYTVISNILLGVTVIGLVFLTRRGHVKLAGALLTCMVWAVITLWCYVAGGILDTSITGYYLVIIIASLVLGRRGAFGFGILCMLTVLAVYLNQIYNFTTSVKPAFFDLVTLLLTLGMAIWLLRFAVDSVTQALVRARQNELTLTENNRKLTQHTRHLELINQLSITMNESTDLTTAIQSAVSSLAIVLEGVNVGQIGLALFDKTHQHLKIVAEHALRMSAPALGIELPLNGNRSMELVLKTKAPLAIDDAQHDPLLAPLHGLMLTRQVSSILLVPLIVRDTVIGTLGCDATGAPHHFTADEIALAQTVANLVAARIERARLDEATRQEIAERQRIAESLQESEARYKGLFEDSPISLWEEDFSQVKACFDDLRASGITDFKTYFETHPHAVVECTKLVRVVDVNKATLDILGVSDKSQVIGGLGQFLADEALQVFKNELTALANGELRFESDEVHRTLTGAERFITVRLTVAPGYEHSLGKVLISVIDVTERKRIEQALTDQHQLLRTLIDSVPDSVYIKDTESRFLAANNAVANLMSTTPEELIGKTDWDFYPKELAAEYYNDEQAIIQTGRGLIGKDELQVNPSTGQRRWVSTTKVPFRDQQGHVKGIVGIGRDLTERREMELALQKAHDELELRVEQRTADFQRANEQLAALYRVGQTITAPLQLDVVLNLIARSTADLLGTDTGVILLLDDASTTLHIESAYGLSEGVVRETRDHVGESIAGRVVQTGKPIIANDLPNDPRFFNPSAAQEGLLACASVPLIVNDRIIGTLDVHSKTNRFAFSAEHIRILEMLASQAAIAIENARLYKRLELAHDELEIRVHQRTEELVTANQQLQQEITERERVEAERKLLIAELKAKNTELEHFTYTVSHDLKSPLITIKGFADFLEQDAIAGEIEQVKADAMRITNAAKKMEQLLNELLELSRIGRLINPPQEFAFGDLARETINLLAGQLSEHGVQVDIAPDLPIVWGDRQRLRQVLQNLVENAVKYRGNQTHPRIEIGVRRGADAAEPVLFVRDNGMGIEAQYHEKIFGLFEKLDAQSEGTGIGLAIVKRIIEFHGGRIWVESAGRGSGSTFCFTLPSQSSNKLFSSAQETRQ